MVCAGGALPVLSLKVHVAMIFAGDILQLFCGWSKGCAPKTRRLCSWHIQMISKIGSDVTDSLLTSG
ncbi:hypothetical protein Y1Q_0011777 [Alligator mississippiensis]|uniref:Secreted protein n=1 Tax=Alligator mississippiensis TaxID=8496 RepID=A0A151M163_ALLMI|nr:hypothetical protein Y1Q_0011777 [Alligator mississippiensis]